jgi:DNA repair protein RecN (Recombination protein N)
MLTHLHIRHFAIIDKTELELESGMTALTGETGAGKSILLDALGLVLGARSSGNHIQQGADRAEVTATFDIDKLPSIQRWLKSQDLDNSDECLMRRVLTSSGKNRASINGTPVSVQQLKELGQQLVSIHGQNEHQLLATPAAQRQLLDAFCNSNVASQVAKAFDAWQDTLKRYEAITSSSQASQDRLDLVQFQLQEFESLDIGATAIADIESEHHWLANADRIMQLSASVIVALDEDNSASDALSKAIEPLTELTKIDARLQEALDLIESAQIQTTEAASLLRNHASGMEHDEQRLAWLDDKLSGLHRLAKKHQVSVNELHTVESALREELENLTTPEGTSEQLEKEVTALQQVYLDQATKLTRLRKKHAKLLSATISESMQTLAMEGGIMQIDITTDKKSAQRHGQDLIVFNVSPNPGVKPAPLAKVASGGELSRISLCIQLATINSQPVDTLIFDEVDAGVGGAVAETVGRLLRKVGSHAQVLCVTHLPQVASQAHNHYRVSKHVDKGLTRTQLEPLSKKETCEEIARMLGGSKITKKSRQHAQEMLDSAID